jgi:hypothetical protein
MRNAPASCAKTLREHGFHRGIVTNGYNYTSDIHARLPAVGVRAVTLSRAPITYANRKNIDKVPALKQLLTSKKYHYHKIYRCFENQI